MVIQSFLYCFNIREGSWICGVASLLLGALRVCLQRFNLEFRLRMTKTARKQLPVEFSTLQLITTLQLSAAAISIAVSLVMLVGLFKRWRWLLCPWMVWVVIEELFSILVIIFFASVGLKLKCSVYISEAVMLLVCVYSMLCVYSYFNHLKRLEMFNRSRALGEDILDVNELDDDPRSPLLVNRLV